MTNICKNGLPQGDLFEYAAFMFQNYELKWKNIKSKEVKEKIMKYKEDKQKSVRIGNIKYNKVTDENVNNRSIDLSKDITKSRSSAKILPDKREDKNIIQG